MKYYYALSDYKTGDDPEKKISGCPNKHKVIYFDTKKERNEWVENTKLSKARALTRNEAINISRYEQIESFKIAKIARKYKSKGLENYIIFREAK